MCCAMTSALVDPWVRMLEFVFVICGGNVGMSEMCIVKCSIFGIVHRGYGSGLFECWIVDG